MKSKEIKSKNKLIVSVNLFLIAILMVVAVYAWFASNANNRVDGYDIEVQSNNTLELSFDGKSWSDSLNLNDLKNTDGESVMDKMKFVEVTGNGDNFVIPQLTQFDNYAAINKSADAAEAVANRDYLKFTVHMRAKEPLKIYLGPQSKASPASSQVTGANCGNKSSYGDFSRDCIVGALRVAVKDSADTQKFIWITNPNFHLNNNVGSSTYSMTADAEESDYQDGTGHSGQAFEWNNPFKHYYYNSESKDVVTADALTSLPQITDNNDSTLIATLSGSQDSEGYYTSQATFTVWTEGCDTEARRALVNGEFNLRLVLDSVTVVE